jgi:ribosomal protein RSM22 (predicted rRNA methylase)
MINTLHCTSKLANEVAVDSLAAYKHLSKQDQIRLRRNPTTPLYVIEALLTQYTSLLHSLLFISPLVSTSTIDAGDRGLAVALRIDLDEPIS